MKYGVVILALVPLRAEPSEKSELISQALLGQLFHLREERDQWICISLDDDSYSGWVDRKMVALLSKERYMEESSACRVVVNSLLGVLQYSNGNSQLISMGAQLRLNSSRLFVNNQEVILDSGTFVEMNQAFIREELIEQAYLFLNTPYLWGGKSPLGIDCSGFMQVLFSTQGKLIKRDASQQVMQGDLVAFNSDALAGDLAFFDNEEGAIIHVGLITGGDTIIHSSGQVRIDHWDSQGIYHETMQRYTHHLRVIRRFF